MFEVNKNEETRNGFQALMRMKYGICQMYEMIKEGNQKWMLGFNEYGIYQMYEMEEETQKCILRFMHEVKMTI